MGHEFFVVYVVDYDVGFGSGVGRGFFMVGVEGGAGFGFFDKKLVVADYADDLVVAIDAVFSEHFFVGDRSGAVYLVADVGYEICTGCQWRYLPFFVLMEGSLK